MTQALSPQPIPFTRHHRSAGRRFGYLVAIGINAVMLSIANHLLEWDWPSFLTDEFNDVLGIITVSFVATMIANAMFVVFDAPWFKSLANAVTAAIAIAVAWRMLQVFPFDFTGYDRDWSDVARIVLVFAMLGAAVGCLVEMVRFVTWPFRDHSDTE